MYFGLDKFLIISGKRENKEVTPLHKNINGMDSNFVNILPVIHILAGCYKTSKVGKKSCPSGCSKMGLQFIIFIWKIRDI